MNKESYTYTIEQLTESSERLWGFARWLTEGELQGDVCIEDLNLLLRKNQHPLLRIACEDGLRSLLRETEQSKLSDVPPPICRLFLFQSLVVLDATLTCPIPTCDLRQTKKGQRHGEGVCDHKVILPRTCSPEFLDLHYDLEIPFVENS